MTRMTKLRKALESKVSADAPELQRDLVEVLSNTGRSHRKRIRMAKELVKSARSTPGEIEMARGLIETYSSHIGASNYSIAQSEKVQKYSAVIHDRMAGKYIEQEYDPFRGQPTYLARAGEDQDIDSLVAKWTSTQEAKEPAAVTEPEIAPEIEVPEVSPSDEWTSPPARETWGHDDVNVGSRTPQAYLIEEHEAARRRILFGRRFSRVVTRAGLAAALTFGAFLGLTHAKDYVGASEALASTTIVDYIPTEAREDSITGSTFTPSRINSSEFLENSMPDLPSGLIGQEEETSASGNLSGVQLYNQVVDLTGGTPTGESIANAD